MGGGYVLDFSNRTFEEFFREVVEININAPQYQLGSASKAQRLRAFWAGATKEQLLRFFAGIQEAWSLYSNSPAQDSAREVIDQILIRLGGTPTSPERTVTTKQPGPIGEAVSRKLNDELIALTRLTPQKRGYALEALLRNCSTPTVFQLVRPFELLASRLMGVLSCTTRYICSKQNGRTLQPEHTTCTPLRESLDKRLHGHEGSSSASLAFRRMDYSPLDEASASFAWMVATYSRC